MNVHNEPPGAPAPSGTGRNAVLRIYSGDTMRVRMRLYLPGGAPATAANSTVEAALVNQLFDAPSARLWAGAWGDGVVEIAPSDHPGLVDITVPHTVADTLRRGQYMLGVRVTTRHGSHATISIPAVHLLVDYGPVATTHSIPYKD